MLADQSIREKEQGLSRLQAFHENIVHSISSGVFTTDEKGAITSFNPAAQEATGYGLEQVQGRPWREVFNWHPSQQMTIAQMCPPTCGSKWSASGPTAIGWFSA